MSQLIINKYTNISVKHIGYRFFQNPNMNKKITTHIHGISTTINKYTNDK